MTRTRRRRLLLLACLLVGLSCAVGLMLSAFSKDMLYFHEPSAVVNGQVKPGVRFRLGGLVQMGSVSRPGNGMTVHFRVADCVASVPVVYTGTLPDLFRAGQGVIAYGKMNTAGVFVADRILAKHNATYMSEATKKALKMQTKHPCMPARLKVS